MPTLPAHLMQLLRARTSQSSALSLKSLNLRVLSYNRFNSGKSFIKFHKVVLLPAQFKVRTCLIAGKLQVTKPVAHFKLLSFQSSRLCVLPYDVSLNWLSKPIEQSHKQKKLALPANAGTASLDDGSKNATPVRVRLSNRRAES
jgi:hypothetical protein